MNQRQEDLLKIIVEEYIKNAHPIGSKAICELLDCSSATIRNEMVVLEDLGFIEKEHISSGRIPSEDGYRYYVDHLMNKKASKKDLYQLEALFAENKLISTDTISKSLEIIAELTNYTAIVLGASSRENLLKQVEIVPLEDNKFIAIIITDKGHVEHKTILLKTKVSLKEMKQTVELINRLVVGTPIDEVGLKLETEIKPIISQYVKQYEMLYDAFYNAFNDFTKGSNLYLAGRNNILRQPEFNNVDKIREIMDKFDDQNLINKIIEEDTGINIYIGQESQFDDDVTVIKTKYHLNGEEGTIMIVGPKRMEYDRVVSMLEYIKENLDER